MKRKHTEKHGSRDNEGVSPVIGVVLIVAITLVLATVVGTFVLNISSETRETATAGVSVDDGEVRLITMGNTDEVIVEVEGTELGRMTKEGDTVPIAVPGEVTVSVIGVVDGDETLIRSKTVEDAGDAGATLALVNEGEGTDSLPLETEADEVWNVNLAVESQPDFNLVYCVDDDIASGDLDGDRCTEQSLDGIQPPLDSIEIRNNVLNTNSGDIVRIDTFRLEDESGNVIDEVTAADTFVDDGSSTVSLELE